MTTEKLWKILRVDAELENGEEFSLENTKNTYKFVNNKLMVQKGNKWIESLCSADVFISSEVIKIPWFPKDGETFYYLDVAEACGWSARNEQSTARIILNREGKLFRSLEEVVEEAKYLGWRG